MGPGSSTGFPTDFCLPVSLAVRLPQEEAGPSDGGASGSGAGGGRSVSTFQDAEGEEGENAG